MERKHKGLEIENNHILSSLITTRTNVLPILKITGAISVIPSIGGGLAFDSITKTPFYCDGSNWFPLASEASFNSYSLKKNIVQSIPSSTDTTLTGWTSPIPFHSLGGWNLATGIYTAVNNQHISSHLNVTWSPNITNSGRRIIKLEYRQSPGVIWTSVVSSTNQASANVAIPLSQSVSMDFNLLTGDSIRAVVFQDSGINIDVSSETFISGNLSQL